MDSQLIHQIIHSFYEKAKVDLIIGYHFRNIQDFDQHIPHIARFWEIQLLGKKLEGEPFDMINKHLALQFNQGQLDRWIKLFIDNLNEFELSEEDRNNWLSKIEFFKNKLISITGMIRN